jgi:hypothetical protein
MLRTTRRRGRTHALPGIILGVVALVLCGASQAGQPAALVVELSGDTEPALFPFSEIEAGTEIRLSDESRLGFVHYGTCKMVIMIGGEVRIERRRYLIRRGRVESERAQDCPREVVLDVDGTAAGVLMRSGETVSAMPLRPSFVFAGARADGIASVEVRAGDVVVATLPAEGRRAAWPETAPDLEAGTVYAVEIAWADGTRRGYDFVAEPHGRQRLLILRLE